MKRVVVTGGSGSFSKNLATECMNRKDYEFLFLAKDRLDVRSMSSIESVLDLEKPDIFLHAGAITRPMVVHKENPALSIETNIIGTSNCAIACLKRGIKIVYISTDHVYPGEEGNYSEKDPVLPVNEYAWSKLGGECAIKMCKDSLILRVAMVEDPFPHRYALVDSIKSAISQKDAAKICIDLLEETGIVNVGGKSQSMYDFVSSKTEVGRIKICDIKDVNVPANSSLDTTLMEKIVNNKSKKSNQDA